MKASANRFAPSDRKWRGRHDFSELNRYCMRKSHEMISVGEPGNSAIGICEMRYAGAVAHLRLDACLTTLGESKTCTQDGVPRRRLASPTQGSRPKGGRYDATLSFPFGLGNKAAIDRNRPGVQPIIHLPTPISPSDVEPLPGASMKYLAFACVLIASSPVSVRAADVVRGSGVTRALGTSAGRAAELPLDRRLSSRGVLRHQRSAPGSDGIPLVSRRG